MKSLKYVLVSDGSSDRMLIPILNWLLRDIGVEGDVQSQWAEITKGRLSDRIEWAIKHNNCDVVFVHRDAENQTPDLRRNEIREACEEICKITKPYICVVPVRMSESWLLFDERAIRLASDNPKGRVGLGMPSLGKIESLSDAKLTLHQLLIQASEYSGRRLDKFKSGIHHRVRRVSDTISDFAPLKTLPAFQRLEADVRSIAVSGGWV